MNPPQGINSESPQFGVLPLGRVHQLWNRNHGLRFEPDESVDGHCLRSRIAGFKKFHVRRDGYRSFCADTRESPGRDTLDGFVWISEAALKSRDRRQVILRKPAHFRSSSAANSDVSAAKSNRQRFNKLSPDWLAIADRNQRVQSLDAGAGCEQVRIQRLNYLFGVWV